MKEGPDIALLGSVIGDPARANMLTALMSGRAHTASELAAEAGVGLPTASSHLRKLEATGLVRQRKQGRHRYFALADPAAGAVLEAMMGFAARRGHMRSRTGPRDPALRKARICYDHLAGELGVRLFDSMVTRGLLHDHDGTVTLSAHGREFVAGFGIDLAALATMRRPLCRSCLDWSARRTHLAGALGAALLREFYRAGWARRVRGSRVVAFTGRGEAEFLERFPA